MKIKTATISGLIANETNRMNSLPTQRLCDDLYIIQDSFANIFLIKTDEGYVAIDAGISPERISRELEKLNIDKREIIAVLLTHSDIDHVNGISAFPFANVYISKAEVAMLERPRINVPEEMMLQAEQVFGEFIPTAEQNLFGDNQYWPQEDVEITENGSERMIGFLKNRVGAEFKTLEDREILSFGQTRIEGILITGHTKGLMAYLVNNKYIFVGDGMSLQDGRVMPFNATLNLDEALHRKSITKLREMNQYDYLFTQHYGYSDNIAFAFEHWQE